MLLDLGPLPYTKAIEIIQFCVANKIELEKCVAIVESWNHWSEEQELMSYDEVDYVIDIPDKYLTYFAMKWT